jgi:hypothetical protein
MAQIEVQQIGGMCPTQGQGTVDGLPWYYRSRRGEWRLCVAEHSDGDPVDRSAVGWCWVGVDDYDGWVPPSVARKLIHELLSRPRDRWPRQRESDNVVWIGEPWLAPPSEPGDRVVFRMDSDESLDFDQDLVDGPSPSDGS